MKLSQELTYRGMVAQNTFSNIGELDKRKRKFYFGVDPSQSSMTIGNLAALMMCRVFIRHGYEPFLLVGGATGQIGDPKMDKERAKQTPEQIAKNAMGIHDQFTRIMGQNREVHLVNNLAWFKSLNYIEFLNEVGTQFSMTQLLDRDFVKNRIGEGGSGISYAEFSYSLIQGYDYLWLYRSRGVDLQLCGADQYGNSVSGLHLIKRLEGADVDVWSLPLILDANGRKFGKSEGNAIWLDADLTPVFDFYQFWLNVDDAGVGNYLKIYTEIEPAEIDEILHLHAKNPEARGAQKALALGVTEVVHGREAAVNAAHITNVLFGAGDIAELPPAGLELLAATIPTVVKNTTVVDALIKAGICTSRGEVLRLIKAGGISLNGVKISADQPIEHLSILKKGKNQFVLIK
ncbi:MAG: tyrosine--tRNA ligase [Candidatus Nomurabacteria bacterium]|jgi:tyrosyl-tRNA synthetase|nr:tyrosine--tRNA ligase [Candidatus Nomurabacteria bacterium]